MLRTIGWLIVSYCVVGVIGTIIIVGVGLLKKYVKLSLIEDSLGDQFVENFGIITNEATAKMVDDWANSQVMTAVCKFLSKVPDAILMVFAWPVSYFYWYNYVKPMIDEYYNELIEDYHKTKKLEDA